MPKLGCSVPLCCWGVHRDPDRAQRYGVAGNRSAFRSLFGRMMWIPSVRPVPDRRTRRLATAPGNRHHQRSSGTAVESALAGRPLVETTGRRYRRRCQPADGQRHQAPMLRVPRRSVPSARLRQPTFSACVRQRGTAVQSPPTPSYSARRSRSSVQTRPQDPAIPAATRPAPPYRLW